MGQSASTTSSPSGRPLNLDSSAEKSLARCPVDHTTTPTFKTEAQCPIEHSSSSATASAPARCPVDHNSLAGGEINPLNQMPAVAQLPGPNQTTPLPLSRETSSIPREGSSKWEYPSPQQFYNALVRKGWETPEEYVPTMVDIHNFLNEQAWDEILKWEQPRNSVSPELARFKGRPGELSPKARLLLFAGWLLPSRFNTEPPFDRHDWVVRRPQSGEEVRYIIDYYSAPPLPDGSPVFSLDVRPALDSVAGVQARIRGWSSVWNNAATRDKQ